MDIAAKGHSVVVRFGVAAACAGLLAFGSAGCTSSNEGGSVARDAAPRTGGTGGTADGGPGGYVLTGGAGGSVTGGAGGSAAGGTGGRAADATAGSGGAGDTSCRRIDLVFAVDDSSSMQEEQRAMRETVFPAFARRLIEELPSLEDFRAGVIDACPLPANFHTRGDSGACNFESGESWMDSRSGNLEGEFACVGNIYSGDAECTGNNDDEQPASAAAAALEPPAYAPDGPNAGFLRPDAVLVVVAITDEDEQPVPSRTMQQVYERLIAVKGGVVERVVFLGIGGASSCTGVYGSAARAARLRELTNLFIAEGRGVWWDLCGGALENGLGAALDVIKTACDELPPPSCPTGIMACTGDADTGYGTCGPGTYCVSGCCLPVVP